MPQDRTVEFTFADYSFRYTKLAPIPLARELFKLLVRFDHDTGMLNTLAFNFESKDYAEIAKMGPAGMLRLVKLVSMLVKADEPLPTKPDPLTLVEGEEPEIKSRDELPSALDELLLYYVELGQVEYGVLAHGEMSWLPLRSEKDFAKHPCELALYITAFNVLRGMFGPFVTSLREYSEAQAKTKALSGSSSSDVENTSPEAPTSAG